MSADEGVDDVREDDDLGEAVPEHPSVFATRVVGTIAQLFADTLLQELYLGTTPEGCHRERSDLYSSDPL